jgi:magnesium-transporting ATPase (P-type)
MQEDYRLAEGVSEDEANLVFNNAACKVIRNAFKHTRCIYVACYYTHVSILLFCTHVLRLLFFTLTCKCNFLLHVGAEVGDEAHLGQ